MKTAEEYCDEIAKQVYMGQVPDIWNLLAGGIIAKAINSARSEAFEEAAKIAEQFNRPECLRIASEIRAIGLPEEK